MLPPAKKQKMNPLLMKVIVVSIAIHLIVGLIFGSITVVKFIIPDDNQFEEPPVAIEEEPPPEVKIQIRPQQPAEQKTQNLTMRPVANIAVANVNVNLPDMDQSFTVSSGLSGIGAGSLIGNTKGNIGMGISDISIFGLKTRAERILFVIDANRQMVTDTKGGLNSYKVIKDEITDMVGNLSAGTLYNVMLQDRSKVLLFKHQLVSAGSETHNELIKWITPINSNASKPGLESTREASTPKLATLQEEEVHQALSIRSQGNETGFMTQYALEQNIDAIFFITGYHRGFETLRRHASEQEQAEWKRESEKPSYQEQLAKYNAERPQMQARITAEMKKINAARKNKGQPPRVLAKRNDIYSNARELELKWETDRPARPPRYYIEDSDVIRYFREVVDTLYSDRGKQTPSINVVLFLAGDEELKPAWKKQLDDYVRFFRGKNRVIRGLDEIKSARSAKESTN